MTKYCYDTNALMSFSSLLNSADEIIIPEIVIDELDNLKAGLTEKAYRAREAVRKIKSMNNIIIDHVFGRKHSLLDSSKYGKNDDIIVECAKFHNAVLVTGDYLCELKAKSQGVAIFDTSSFDRNNEYTGCFEVILTEDEYESFYDNEYDNTYNLVKNQYIVVRDSENEILEMAKWNGEKLEICRPEKVSSDRFGELSPYDEYQTFALESLKKNQLTMIKGKAGSGKSLLALSYAWSELENKKGKFDKLIVFTNPVASRNSAKLGYYPGTRNEKLLNSQTGTMLSSKFGGIEEVQAQIDSGKLQLLPFSDIRGFDSTGMRAIIWFTESQNLDIDLMKLGISRVGDDCKAILDGDYSGQVDMDAYAGYNNGMRRVSEIFRGEDFYGEIELKYVHRSKMAAIADRM
jgi:predicted ribonuclease YlaK